MTIQELEKQVWEQDRVRIVIRDGATSKVRKYEQRNAAKESWSITGFLASRIRPLVAERQVVVIDGKGRMPNGKTLLRTLRESYN